jgi:hypothetical protein
VGRDAPIQYSNYLNIEWNSSMISTVNLRPQDVVVLLKLALIGDKRPPYLKIAQELHMYPSEVYTSIKRARASQLVQGLQDRVNRSALLEFVIHGLRYSFPPERGALTRGLPTAYAAPPLRGKIEGGDDPYPVWPYVEGPARGYSFSPLHKNVPQAALEDAKLYELLALVDAIRDGRARERTAAIHELKQRLEDRPHGKS